MINPSTDLEFVAVAQRFLEGGVTSPEEFERRLRAEYPRAVVHARQLAEEPILI